MSLTTLEQFLRNKASSTAPSEQILGAKDSDKWATFYKNNKDSVALAKDALLVEYINNKSFTPEAVEAFKLGQSSITSLFEQALLDRDMKAQEALAAQSEKSDSVQ